MARRRKSKKTGWNYRFFRVQHKGQLPCYEVHEAYYDRHDRVVAMTAEPTRLAGYEDADSAEFEVARVLIALGKPALDASDVNRKQYGFYREVGPVPWRKIVR